MDYINNGSESSLVQDVLKMSLQNYKLSVYKTKIKVSRYPDIVTGPTTIFEYQNKLSILLFLKH